MKRKLSVIVLAAMLAAVCLSALVACKAGLDNDTLTIMLNEVKKQANKGQGKTNYTLDRTVKLLDSNDKEIACAVDWDTDNEGITLSKGSETIDVTVSAGITVYNLIGTLVNGSGKAYDVKGNPVYVPVSVNGGGNQGGNQGGNNQGGDPPTPGESTTYTLAMGTYGSENSLSDGTSVTSISLDFATLTSSGTPVTGKNDTGIPNTGKWYSGNSGTWRFYQNENPSLVIAAKTGYMLISVKITYTISNTGVLTLNGSNVESGATTSVTGNTITFSVGNTGTATNGQVRIQSIELVYKAA